VNIDIQKITEGEESVVIRYKDPNPTVNRIIGILKGSDGKLWGRTESGNVSIDLKDILYLETVDDKLFAYTTEVVARIEGSLVSFLNVAKDESFFRCSKSMIINVGKVKALKSLSSNRIDATMEGGEHIMISRRYAVDFRRLLKGDRKMSKVVEIENLTKSYGKSRGVIDVSLSIEEGDIFGFLGPNGAGKSTTIRSMLGFLKINSGSIKILGMDSVKDHEDILKNVGYMPSEAWFYESMKVKDVIRYAADVRGLDCSAEAEKLCERLKVDKEKRIKQLSYGNKKKVSIVCAMQHRPRLFIFDEPTGGLDPLMQRTFFNLVGEYVSGGTTCLLSTHVLTEVNKYCRHAAIMREGRLTMLERVDIDDDTFLKFYEDEQ